jgi:hypothetical protein
LGTDLLKLVRDIKKSPFFKRINELRIINGYEKIKVINDKKNLKPLEYRYDSYGNILLKEIAAFDEAVKKISKSLEKILSSDDENILKWKKEIENQKQVT